MVRMHAQEYGLGQRFRPIDLLMILARPWGLKASLEPGDMAGTGVYGECVLSVKAGILRLRYRPDSTLIAELRSQWHEVREAMIMLDKLRKAGAVLSDDSGLTYAYNGEVRHRGDGRGGCFNDEHELDVEGWAISMTLLCLFGDNAPSDDNGDADSEPGYDALLDGLDQ